jgi:hypothetical protein
VAPAEAEDQSEPAAHPPLRWPLRPPRSWGLPPRSGGRLPRPSGGEFRQDCRRLARFRHEFLEQARPRGCPCYGATPTGQSCPSSRSRVWRLPPCGREVRAPLLRVRARMSVPGHRLARQLARLRQHPGDDLPDATHIRMPGPVPVRRAYKFRAYPTRPQDGRASRLLADHCDLYNAARDLGEPGWHQHELPLLRATMYPAAAGDCGLSGARADGRRRERGTQRACQGRTGLWSGRLRCLRSCRPQPSEQSRNQLPLSE